MAHVWLASAVWMGLGLLVLLLPIWSVGYLGGPDRSVCWGDRRKFDWAKRSSLYRLFGLARCHHAGIPRSQRNPMDRRSRMRLCQFHHWGGRIFAPFLSSAFIYSQSSLRAGTVHRPSSVQPRSQPNPWRRSPVIIESGRSQTEAAQIVLAARFVKVGEYRFHS
jgi:hypothetical protein